MNSIQEKVIVAIKKIAGMWSFCLCWAVIFASDYLIDKLK